MGSKDSLIQIDSCDDLLHNTKDIYVISPGDFFLDALSSYSLSDIYQLHLRS